MNLYLIQKCLYTDSYDDIYKTEMIFHGRLALLFQPFFKIALGRQIWNIVDVLVGIGLLGSLILSSRKQFKKDP